MRTISSSIHFSLLLLAFWFGFQNHLGANPVTILHSFGDGTVPNDVRQPTTGLIQATDGNFYSSAPTFSGGQNYATIYRITPSGMVTPLHVLPLSAGTIYGSLIQATDGYLYSANVDTAWGSIYKFHLDGTTSLAASFGSSADGPDSGLIQGADGKLYGTLSYDGTNGGGAIYSFNLSTGALTYPAQMDGPTGAYRSYSALVEDASGNFYGTTADGGSMGIGTIFRMSSTGVITVLHSFGSIPNDGSAILNIRDPLVFGSDGNLYGVTNGGGTGGIDKGILFKITNPASGSPTYSILHNFNDGSVANDGFQPWAGLMQAPDGNLYGTTGGGGSTGTCGTVFEFTPSTGTLTILHSFGDGSVPNDGIFPQGRLVQGTDGSLYGTTNEGGSAGLGTVFKIDPTPPVILAPETVIFTAGKAGSVPVIAPPVFSVTGLPAWATLNHTTGVLSGTPPNTTGSPFTVVAKATNGLGLDVSQTITIYVEPASNTYATWAGTFFTPAQMSDPTISGETAVPQYDQVSNLLKYAFDIDPNEAMTSADYTALPTPGTTTIGGAFYLMLTYRKNISATDLHFNIQTSPDLQSWTTVTPDFSNTLSTNPATGDPIIQAGVNVTGAPYYFIRLQVTTP